MKFQYSLKPGAFRIAGKLLKTMNRMKSLRGECQECGGPLEFPAESFGTVGKCPHCGKETELLLPSPPEEEPAVSRRTVIWCTVGLVVLAIGLVLPLWGLKHYQKVMSQKQAPATNTVVTNQSSGATQ